MQNFGERSQSLSALVVRYGNIIGFVIQNSSMSMGVSFLGNRLIHKAMIMSDHAKQWLKGLFSCEIIIINEFHYLILSDKN